MARERPIYPFSALVGQERLKRALILNAINPRVGGVLIRGEKGTAKSTAVRGLAGLLPPIEVVADDPYNSSPSNPALMSDECRARFDAGEELPMITRPTPLIELPVAASEDRVVGSLDLEHALTEGQRRFEPGLLAHANRGLLYVDEVNLLDDHLVDVLLDAAAMGVNTVEREEISGITDVGGRVAVIERRMTYDADPAHFSAEWQNEEQVLAQRIIAARALLPAVHIARSDMAAVAALALELGVDGHRADLAILETARTHAAWSSRANLTIDDIRIAAELALPHRMRRQPFTEVKLDEGRMNAILDRATGEEATENTPSVEGVKKKHL